jgi:hypothetical protein
MGAINFSLDDELVRALKKTLPLDYFVETGTFEGDTAIAAAAHFGHVYTIELSDEIYRSTAARLSTLVNVQPIHGSSPESLRELKPNLRLKSVLYWLDAHWCGTNTSGKYYECPLTQELEAIEYLNRQSVILIDDARFFLSPPMSPHDVRSWPMLVDVVQGLLKLSDYHKLWVINDVMVFAPEPTFDDVVQYGRKFGVDLYGLRLRLDAAEAASRA